MKINNKLCIGTVQLGQSYGPQKNKKIISLNEISKFVRYLKKNKIRYIDTALNYNFDKRIKDLNLLGLGIFVITLKSLSDKFKSFILLSKL